MLTVKKCERLPAPERWSRLYSDEKNLYLQITPAGIKSWLLWYTSPSTKKRRQMGLGPLHTVSLDEAREKARECRQQLLAGIDPLERKAQQKSEQALASSRLKTFEQ